MPIISRGWEPSSLFRTARPAGALCSRRRHASPRARPKAAFGVSAGPGRTAWSRGTRPHGRASGPGAAGGRGLGWVGASGDPGPDRRTPHASGLTRTTHPRVHRPPPAPTHPQAQARAPTHSWVHRPPHTHPPPEPRPHPPPDLGPSPRPHRPQDRTPPRPFPGAPPPARSPRPHPHPGSAPRPAPRVRPEPRPCPEAPPPARPRPAHSTGRRRAP